MTEPAFREESWVLIGRYLAVLGLWLAWRVHHRYGDARGVHADADWMLAREEAHGDILGAHHTHAPGCGTRPSQDDTTTARLWSMTTGRPQVCLITCGRETTATLFRHRRDKGIRVWHLRLGPLVLVKNAAKETQNG